MLSVIISLPQSAPQSALLRMLTCASCSNSGIVPPPVSLPHPVMKQSSPPVTSSLGRHATSMQSLRGAGTSNSTMAKSYRVDGLDA
jgi:hypothetical protein